MTAMFVVIFLNQWEKEKQHISALIGILVPLVCLVVFGSGSFPSARYGVHFGASAGAAQAH